MRDYGVVKVISNSLGFVLFNLSFPSICRRVDFKADATG